MKVKAVEKLLKFDKNSAGVYRYVMSPEMYSSLNQKKVIKEAALRSGVSQGVMQACWDAAGEVIRTRATEGHSVPLPGLGTMRFGVRSKAVAELEDVKANLITTRRIIFTPNVDVKDELKNTAIQITCLDEDGNVLKRVTSGDSGEIEEDGGEHQSSENGSTGDGENGSTENGGSQNQGGSGTGSLTPSLTSPTISGNTQFTDSTQVSMSGPDGAEIHYTTDGSVPTVESAVYSEAFSLSATTTVKAIAIKDGQSSEVVSKLFTKSSGGDLGQN